MSLPVVPQESVGEQRLVTVLERITDAFFAVDVDWCITYVNQRCATLSRLHRSQMLGRRLQDVFPDLEESVFERQYRLAMAHQVPVTFEAEFLPLSLWVEVHAYPAADGLSVYFRDIAERKQAEQLLMQREQEFETLAENATDVIHRFDREQRYLYVNRATELETNTPRTLFLGRRHDDPLLNLPRSVTEGWQHGLDRVFQTGKPLNFTVEYDGPNGRHWFEIRLSPEHKAGRVETVLAVARDVSQQREIERALAEREQMLRLATHAADLIPWQADLRSGTVRAHLAAWQQRHVAPAAPVNDAAGPEEAAQFSGRAVLRQIDPRHRKRVLAACRQAVVEGATLDEQVRLPLADTVRWLHLKGRAFAGSNGPAARIIGVGLDVTERKRLEDELYTRAFHDPLTMLENRYRFRQHLDAAIDELARHGAGSAAVLFVDLDDFKTANDSLGHHVGDELLVMVGERLRQAVGPADRVARLGGDEFALLVKDVAKPGEAERVAEHIRSALQSPFRLAARMVRVSASIGIAPITASSTAEELLRHADLAMYRAKSSGKNRHAAFTPDMLTAAVNRLGLIDDLHAALEQGELHAVFQPVVRLDSGEVTGYEALCRWSHRARGPVPPLEFIPLAEETGLILPLGRWMLATACRAAMAFSRQAGRSLSVSVNVSVRQLQDGALLDDVQAALQQSGLAPSSLILEITESVLMSDAAFMTERLHELSGLGVQLAVDDFGTGFSSLAYLAQFPVHILKIDRAFVHRVTEQARESALVQAIVRLADALSLRCVAEGVEQPTQAQALMDLGCNLGQGFGLGRPVQAEEVLRQLGPCCKALEVARRAG